MTNPKKLDLTSSYDELDKMVSFVNAFCDDQGVSDTIRNKLHLIAEELVVNAVMHGYSGREDGWIGLTLAKDENRIEMVYADEATAFNPLEDSKEPELEADLEDRNVGGLGIYLIKEFAKDVQYHRAGSRNTLSIVVDT